MTPSSTTNPLAALLNAGSGGQSTTASPVSPASESGTDGVQGKSQFFNILQVVKGSTSSENPLTLAQSEVARFSQNQPSGLQPWSGLGGDELKLNQSVTLTGQSVTGPDWLTSGQAQLVVEAQNGDSNPLGFYSSFSSEIKLNQDITDVISSELSSVIGPLSSAISGSQAPLGGNGLPGGQSEGALLQRNILWASGGAASDPAAGSQALGDAARGAAAIGPLKAESFPQVMAPAQFERMPIPEFALPLTKFQGQTATALTTASGSVDVSSLIDKPDSGPVELNRVPLPAVSTDKPAVSQQALTTITLPRPAGVPGWDQGLGQRILWMVDSGLNQAELRLDPPNLGSVNIRISMHEDQAQLQFQAANQAAREALESALPKLREMFNQQGLELGDADVSDQNQPDGDASDTDQQGNLQARSDGSSEAGSATTSADTELSESGVQFQHRAENSVLVDEFV